MSTLQKHTNEQIELAVVDVASDQKQRRRMLAALALLLAALILVLVKDGQFWFSSPPAAESEPAEQAPPASAQDQSQPQAPVKPPATVSKRGKTKSHAVAANPAPAAPDGSAGPVITTTRAVLPPLEVEVVAGDQHQTLQPGTNSVKVELQPAAPAAAEATVDRVTLSPGTADVLTRPVEPNYPLLARQMKVQGAVVLRALIGKTGDIQDLQVLSGPTILSAAAREAVKQWHFKPYLQSGQAVETEARITVNFTISTY